RPAARPATVPSSLSLHDALPIWSAFLLPGTPHPPILPRSEVVPKQCFCPEREVFRRRSAVASSSYSRFRERWFPWSRIRMQWCRSEEHTSELQSRFDLVCRLLLE